MGLTPLKSEKIHVPYVECFGWTVILYSVRSAVSIPAHEHETPPFPRRRSWLLHSPPNHPGIGLRIEYHRSVLVERRRIEEDALPQLVQNAGHLRGGRD